MEFNATFIIATISFIVFVFVLNQILYKPMAKIVKMREKYISDNNISATNSQNLANDLIEDKNKKTRIANQEAKDLINKQSNIAKEEKSVLLNQALSNFKNRVEENKNSLIQEKEYLKDTMTSDTENIANAIISKLIGKEI